MIRGRFCSRRFAFILIPTTFVAFGLPNAREADSEIEQLKAQFQAQIERLEKRIDT